MIPTWKGSKLTSNVQRLKVNVKRFKVNVQRFKVSHAAWGQNLSRQFISIMSPESVSTTVEVRTPWMWRFSTETIVQLALPRHLHALIAIPLLSEVLCYGISIFEVWVHFLYSITENTHVVMWLFKACNGQDWRIPTWLSGIWETFLSLKTTKKNISEKWSVWLTPCWVIICS